MKKVIIAIASLGLVAGSVVAASPAVAAKKNSWTFRGSFAPGQTFESKVIYVPEGRYRISATGTSFPCPADGGEYCSAGQSESCVNRVSVVIAPGNKGFTDMTVSRPRNSPNPAAPLTETFMHSNNWGNGKYYVEVSDYYALNDLSEEMAVAGFRCNFKVTIKKIK